MENNIVMFYDGELCRCGDCVTNDLKEGKIYIIKGVSNNKLKVIEFTNNKFDNNEINYPYSSLYNLGNKIGEYDCGGEIVLAFLPEFKNIRKNIIKTLDTNK